VGLHENGEAKGPKSEALRADRGGDPQEGMFPHQLRGFGECCQFPQ